MYDQLGHERFMQAEKQGATDSRGGRGARAGGDPFGGAGGMGDIGDIFEQFFGGGRGRSRSGPSAGRDLRTSLEIDLEEAYQGVTKQVTVRRPETCESWTSPTPSSESK